MKYENAYFFTGTAYAGKSTMVRRLAEKYGGIACEENYHNALLSGLDRQLFPGLTYTRDLEDWHDFVRRTPEEYEAWINMSSRECELLELGMLETICKDGRPVFVDTNISVKTLHEISDRDHVMIMLADPMISVSRFFDRPDREKQFLYRLMLEEPDPEASLANFRACLSRINSKENYDAFLHCGFQVVLRDENRSVEETMALVETKLKLK